VISGITKNFMKYSATIFIKIIVSKAEEKVVYFFLLIFVVGFGSVNLCAMKKIGRLMLLLSLCLNLPVFVSNLILLWDHIIVQVLINYFFFNAFRLLEPRILAPLISRQSAVMILQMIEKANSFLVLPKSNMR
jgi:hypothetical protein